MRVSLFKTVFSILFVLVFVSALLAQPADIPATIRWGEELREPSGTRIIKIVDSGPYGFYALRKRDTGPLATEQVYVELYDSKMKLRRSQKLELKYKGKLRDFEDLIMVGGELYLLTSFNNQAKKKNYLFYQKLSPRFRPQKDPVYLAEIDTRNKVQEGLFDLEISKDSSKVLLYNELPFKKNSPQQFAFRVLDNGFNPIWEKDIVLPYNDANFVIEEYRVDNNGNVFLLGVLFKDKVRVRRQGTPNYQYIILAYTQNGEKVDEYKIGLKDKFITDLTFRISNEGDLVCSGFYSDKGTYSIKGTYFFRIETASKEVVVKNLMPFDFKFLTEYMPDGQKRRAARAEQSGNARKAPELYRFSLDDLVLRSDGGALLVAEQYYVYERFYRFWDGSLRYDYYYNYNDIIVVNIRPDGEIEWSTRIPKQQETMNDGGYFSSYAMSIVKDRIYLIFNDNSRNFDPQNTGRRLYNFNGRQSVIALTEITKDGVVNTYPLFHNSDASVITRPKICKQIGSRKMMVYGERNRSYRFAHLEFDK